MKASLKNSPERERDRAWLIEAFYRSYDQSRIEALLLDERRLDARFPGLGEGYHFRVWHLRGGGWGGEGSDQVELVLKIAKPTLGSPESPARRHWREAIMHLRHVGGLVPPFELVERDGVLGLVMPYGPDPWSKAQAHWQPLEERILELRLALASHGLRLEDLPQGRSVRGVPFLCDVSDVVREHRA